MAISIAPWLQPPDFLAAMRGGAEAGLGSARISQAAAEAAARTKLGYAQLQAEQNANMARIAAAREAQAIQAAESLRGHGLRELALAQEQQNRVTDNERAAAALGLQERHQGFLERNEFRPRVENVGGALVEFDPRTGAAKELLRPNPAPGTMTQFDKGILDDARIRRRGLERDLNSINSMPFRANIEKQIAEVDEIIKRHTPTAPQAAAPTLPSAPTIPPENYFFAGDQYDAPAHRAPVELPTPKSELQSKVEMANEIARQNPTWTKEQVLNAMQRQVSER